MVCGLTDGASIASVERHIEFLENLDFHKSLTQKFTKSEVGSWYVDRLTGLRHGLVGE